MLTTPTQPNGTVFWWVPSVLEREREFRKVGVNLQVGYIGLLVSELWV